MLPLISFSQKKKEEADTVKVKRDYRPTQIRVGTDVLAIIKSFSQDGFKSWEINGDVNSDRYFFAVDVGYSAIDRNSETDHYENKGSYFRVGGDFNFLKKDPKKNPDNNVLFMGVRYAHSKFSEEMTIGVIDPVWGNFQQPYNNTGAKANWLEFTGGLKVKVWKAFWLGYTTRYKFGLSASENPTTVPHEIPGFGSNEKKSIWGFNYQMFFMIPIKKQE